MPNSDSLKFPKLANAQPSNFGPLRMYFFYVDKLLVIFGHGNESGFDVKRKDYFDVSQPRFE